MGSNSRGRAVGYHLATLDAGTRAKIDDPVSRLHRIEVMLHDYEGITQIAQAQQGVEELTVVALVQTNTWLIQDVHDPDEPRADL